MIQKLSIDEVTSLLGISTDSVLNHIKKKRLTAATMQNKDETIYVFEFGEIQDFASEYLDIELSEPEGNIKMSGMFFEEDHKEEVKPKKKSNKSKSKNSEENKDETGTTNVFNGIINRLKDDYDGVVKQLTDYKEQAAFQIGQLKSKVESTQTMLTSGKKDMETRDLMIRKLKKKLRETQEELVEEKEAFDNMTLFERVFGIKKKK